jgi:hypothetical protein
MVYGTPNISEIKRVATKILREIMLQEEVDKDRRNMEGYKTAI